MTELAAVQPDALERLGGALGCYSRVLADTSSGIAALLAAIDVTFSDRGRLDEISRWARESGRDCCRRAGAVRWNGVSGAAGPGPGPKPRFPSAKEARAAAERDAAKLLEHLEAGDLAGIAALARRAARNATDMEYAETLMASLVAAPALFASLTDGLERGAPELCAEAWRGLAAVLATATRDGAMTPDSIDEMISAIGLSALANLLSFPLDFGSGFLRRALRYVSRCEDDAVPVFVARRPDPRAPLDARLVILQRIAENDETAVALASGALEYDLTDLFEQEWADGGWTASIVMQGILDAERHGSPGGAGALADVVTFLVGYYRELDASAQRNVAPFLADLVDTHWIELALLDRGAQLTATGAVYGGALVDSDFAHALLARDLAQTDVADLLGVAFVDARSGDRIIASVAERTGGILDGGVDRALQGAVVGESVFFLSELRFGAAVSEATRRDAQIAAEIATWKLAAKALGVGLGAAEVPGAGMATSLVMKGLDSFEQDTATAVRRGVGEWREQGRAVVCAILIGAALKQGGPIERQRILDAVPDGCTPEELLAGAAGGDEEGARATREWAQELMQSPDELGRALADAWATVSKLDSDS